MSERAKLLWREMMAGVPPVDESVPITSSDINRQTAERIAPETRAFISGRARTFGSHSVCTSCGAMVDNEYLVAHRQFHEPGPVAA